MKQWKQGAVTLACEELKNAVKGKKIALMMNNSAIDNEGKLLVDVMVEEKWAEIAFFLGMEHGVRGNHYASSGDDKDIDEKTGVKIISLYGFPEMRPPVELVSQVDAVVFCAPGCGRPALDLYPLADDPDGRLRPGRPGSDRTGQAQPHPR